MDVQLPAPEKEAPGGSAQAVRAASLLILLQVASRAATFIANQLLLRFLTAQLFGIATQLEVYYLSVLFFARESLRVAIQRQGPDTALAEIRSETTRHAGTKFSKANAEAYSTQAVVNLGYISIVIGLLVALTFGGLYLAALDEASIASTPNLPLSLYLYALAALVELLSEPAFVVMQVRLLFGVRAAAESVATVTRCVIALGSAAWAAHNGVRLGVLPFALGQIGYGTMLLAVYAWNGIKLARKDGFSLFPTRLDTYMSTVDIMSSGQTQIARLYFPSSYVYPPTLQLASSLMTQSIVKHILTQGDTFLISILSSPVTQGVYALANNYGGLVARLLFQPVEESSRNYFSRLLSPSSQHTIGDQQSFGQGSSSKAAMGQASSNLQSLLKVYVLFSLVVTMLGPAAAPLVLSFVAGPQWTRSGAGECLAVYMWYIPLLAVNGVSEAFVASVATEAEVHRQSVWMSVFSGGFAAAGFVFLRLLDMGATGLVIANAINMLCRIIWCMFFISSYFQKAGVVFDISAVWPRPMQILIAVITSQFTARIADGVGGMPLSARETILTLIKITAAGLPCLTILLASERQFLLQCYRSLTEKGL